MFDLKPVDTSNGDVVYQQMEAAVKRTGIIPREVLTDQGSDLKKGLQLFCEAHPETVHVFDIVHQGATLLKKELESDPRWATFFTQMGSSKKRLVQTSLAALLPPTPRTKARYMNLEPLIKWGQRLLRFLDNPQPLNGKPVDAADLEAKLGWLRDYREALADWGGASEVIRTVLDFVRRNGYYSGGGWHLRKRLPPRNSATMGGRLRSALLAFVRSQCKLARRPEYAPDGRLIRPGEHLLGSSECLESLIGKGKRLEGQQSKGGFTRMLLALAAAVVTPTSEYVAAALTSTTTQDVLDWVNDHIGTSLQAQRRLALNPGTKVG